MNSGIADVVVLVGMDECEIDTTSMVIGNGTSCETPLGFGWRGALLSQGAPRGASTLGYGIQRRWRKDRWVDSAIVIHASRFVHAYELMHVIDWARNQPMAAYINVTETPMTRRTNVVGRNNNE